MRINIACGGNIFPGWVNSDLVDMNEAYLRHLRGLAVAQMHGWPPGQIELSRAITEGRVQFFQWDLRKGFPMYADGSCEKLYLGQAWEHLHPHREAPALAKECFRLLELGGVMRITTPDIKKILGLYNDGRLSEIAPEQPAFFASASPEAQLSYLLFGASGDDCTREDYHGHFHVWSEADLTELLVSVGFSSVERCDEPSLEFKYAGVQDFGISHSMGIEAVK